MKKIILTLLLLCLSLPTHAEKSEWFDSTYDFTKVKSVAFCVMSNNSMSDFATDEIVDIFYKQIKSGIYDQLKGKCKIISYSKLKEEFSRNSNMTESELRNLAQTNPRKVDELFQEYIKNNYDLLVTGIPITYNMGTQYREGYIYTMPSINTSWITLPNGQMATVTSNGQTVHTRPGGNFPTVYVCFRFNIADVKSMESEEKIVWARLDDRARVNEDILQNSKPKDVFKRIMRSFAQDFVNVINTKKATQSKSNDYGF